MYFLKQISNWSKLKLLTFPPWKNGISPGSVTYNISIVGTFKIQLVLPSIILQNHTKPNDRTSIKWHRCLWFICFRLFRSYGKIELDILISQSLMVFKLKFSSPKFNVSYFAKFLMERQVITVLRTMSSLSYVYSKTA